MYVPIVSGQGGVPIDNHAALSVVGRDANSIGDAADIVAGTSNTVLKRDGNSLVFDKVKSQDIDSQEVKTGNLDNKAVTTGKLDDNAVEDGKFRQSTGLSVVGRAGSTTGNVGDITAASDNTVLKRDGNNLVFDEVKAADIDMSDLISSLISEGTGTMTGTGITGSFVRWSRVGNIVTFFATITLTDSASGQLNWGFVGLPKFAHVSSNNRYVFPVRPFGITTDSNSTPMFVMTSSTQGQFQWVRSDGTLAAGSASDITGSNAAVQFSGPYITED